MTVVAVDSAVLAVDPGVLAVDPALAKPGLLGFAVVAGLGVATFLLIRSMMKQIRKIDFEEPPEETERREESLGDRYSAYPADQPEGREDGQTRRNGSR